MQMMANEGSYKAGLIEVFNEIDGDKSGTVTWGQFEGHLQDDKCKLYLQSLNISTQDAWSLFRILDVDLTGALDIDQFVEGCLILKGPAKAMHFVKVERETKALRTIVEQCSADIKKLSQGMIMNKGHISVGPQQDKTTKEFGDPERRGDKELSRQDPPNLSVEDVRLKL